MARAPSSTRKTRVLSNPNCGWHSRCRYRRGSAGRSFGSAQDRLQHANRVCPQSLQSVEGFLKNFEIAGVANLFARILNPLLLQ